MDKEIIRLTAAICTGYERRAAEIRKGTQGKSSRGRVIAEYVRLNMAIDAALDDVCTDALTRETFAKALARGTGYDKAGILYCGRRQYYDTKRNLLHRVAKELALAE